MQASCRAVNHLIRTRKVDFTELEARILTPARMKNAVVQRSVGMAKTYGKAVELDQREKVEVQVGVETRIEK